MKVSFRKYVDLLGENFDVMKYFSTYESLKQCDMLYRKKFKTFLEVVK